MKNYNLTFISVIIILIVSISCSDDEGNVGENLIGTSQINVNYTELNDISITNHRDSLSDLSNISTILLGTLNDEVFGKTQSNAAFQFRLPTLFKLKNPTIDSVKLFLNYTNTYGVDTLLSQEAKVFLLNKDLVDKEIYNSTTDIENMIGDQVGSIMFNIKQIDSTKQLAISLDKDKVGQYILNGPDSIFESSENFVEYFKGLYISTTDGNNSDNVGSLYGFNIYNSYLKLYIKNDIIKENEPGSLYFPVTQESVRFNMPEFNHPDELSNSNELIYLQGLHGIKAKIHIPSIQTWKDSSRNIVINNAELTFTVASDTINLRKYPAPSRLDLFAVGTDGDGKKIRKKVIDTDGFTGLFILNKKTFSTYTFKMPKLIQSIISNDESIDHFELSSADSKDNPSRVILYNTPEYKPTLNITYTKY